jgi:hypothetical protein
MKNQKKNSTEDRLIRHAEFGRQLFGSKLYEVFFKVSFLWLIIMSLVVRILPQFVQYSVNFSIVIAGVSGGMVTIIRILYLVTKNHLKEKRNRE